MKKLSILGLLMLAMGMAEAQYVVITASNKADSNELLVYDAKGSFLQSIATNGKGGVPANKVAGGIGSRGNLVAVINFGSQNVTLFKHTGQSFTLSQVIATQSQPVSVAFSQDHLYILGTTTIESHLLNGETVTMDPDGVSPLLKADGSAAQVGVLTNQLIISEKSNTIELVNLKNGVVTSTITPVQLPPPPKNDTPVGLATKGAVAYVTIAHSNEVGLVKDGELKKVVTSNNQNAPCWLAVTGSFLYCSNTPSKTISLYKVTDTDIVMAQEVAATIQTGGLPSDLDAKKGILAVLDTGNGPGHLSQFQIDQEGNLQLLNTAVTSETANGIAIVDY